MHKEDHSLAAARSSGRKKDDGVWETAKVIIQALAIAFFVRTFFYQPFNIPSSSMYPTLKVGDYLFVSKLSYGYGKYSFNFSLGLGGTTFISCCPIDFEGRKVFWKIDYYDPSMYFGSSDPADESLTRRVMTIMLAEEY